MTRSADELITAIDWTIERLRAAQKLIPDLLDHRRRGKYEPSGPYKTSPNGYKEDHTPPIFDDPVGEEVVNARVQPEELDRRALLRLNAALLAASKTVITRLPALDAQINGRSLSEIVPHGSRPSEKSSCSVCEETVDKIRRGLCNACYMSWRRSDYRQYDAFDAWRRDRLLRVTSDKTAGQGPNPDAA